jgi:hypothetical protein
MTLNERLMNVRRRARIVGTSYGWMRTNPSKPLLERPLGRMRFWAGYEKGEVIYLQAQEQQVEMSQYQI